MPNFHTLGSIHRILTASLFASLLILLFPASASADSDLPEAVGVTSARIELRDHSVIFGEVTDIHDGEIFVSTVLMGDVSIALSSILNLESDQDIELLTNEQETLALSSLMVIDGELVLGDAENLALDQLDVANPEEWEQGHGYRITGRTTSAFEFNRGNTDTDEFNLDLEMIFESRRDRITLRVDYEDSSSIVFTSVPDGEPIRESTSTTDNWAVVGKYDYFLADPRNYLGVNVGFNGDTLADVRRRSYVGPYFGRKLLARDTLKLDAELGISYVDTDFKASDDDSYTGVNLNLTAETQLFDSALKLYFRQVNIVNLSSMQKSIYRTTVGLRFPLLFGLEAAAEATADYDGGAADGKEKLDEALKFRVGYTW